MQQYLMSIGGISTWLWSLPHRSLFDCGEGVSTHMQSYVFGIENVFLSHGHQDHMAGLPALIGARLSMRGAKEKPLCIYYPEGNRSCERWLEHVLPIRTPIDLLITGKSQITALPMPPVVEIGKNLRVESFKTSHGPAPSLGYRVVKDTKRLNAVALSTAKEKGITIETLMRTSSEAEKVTYYEQGELVELVYSGDTLPIEDKYTKGAKVLYHDVTFLKAEDAKQVVDGRVNKDMTHASLPEVLELAKRAGVQHLIGFHISPRYKEGNADDNKGLPQAHEFIKEWKLTNASSMKITLHHPNVRPVEYS